MKYNLKTFPKLVADPTTNEQQVIEWKEGFEKELREIRKMGAEGRHQRYKHPTKWITDQVLDELLGDSE